MEQKPKLEFQVNTPTKIKLTTTSKEGQSRFGSYHLYNIINGDGKSEFSLFAADDLHAQLKQYPKDTELLVTKLAASRGNKIVVSYDVKKIGGEVAVETTVTNQTNQTNPNEEFFYAAMEKSFEDALRIQNRFNGMANVNQIAITLFIQRTKGNHSFAGG